MRYQIYRATTSSEAKKVLEIVPFCQAKNETNADFRSLFSSAKRLMQRNVQSGMYGFSKSFSPGSWRIACFMQVNYSHVACDLVFICIISCSMCGSGAWDGRYSAIHVFFGLECRWDIPCALRLEGDSFATTLANNYDHWVQEVRYSKQFDLRSPIKNQKNVLQGCLVCFYGISDRRICLRDHCE